MKVDLNLNRAFAGTPSGTADVSALFADTEAKPYFGRRKRAFDLALTVALSPLIVAGIGGIALAIKATTKGPVFFKQTRNGRGLEPFTIIKFQTYKENQAVPVFGSNTGAENLTKIGKILRKTSLDELPNFYNVLRGEMSIVGCRPHVVDQDAAIAERVAKWNYRYRELPGITGLAQISGQAGPMETLQECTGRLKWDVEYYENASVWFDIKIIAKTALKALFREKA